MRVACSAPWLLGNLPWLLGNLEEGSAEDDLGEAGWWYGLREVVGWLVQVPAEYWGWGDTGIMVKDTHEVW